MTNNDDVLAVSELNVSYGESKVLFDVRDRKSVV